MRKIFILLSAVALLFACQESMEDRAAREAKEYTKRMCPTPIYNDTRTDSVTFDKLINVSGDSKLCFKPLLPKFEATCTFVWKKYTVFTKAAELFLRQFRQDIEELKNNTEKG